MRKWERPLEAWERKALGDYLQDGSCHRRSANVVDDIIRLAVISASRTLMKRSRTPNTPIGDSRVPAAPALEQRLVALFSE